MGSLDEVVSVALDTWTLLVAGGIYFLLRALRGVPFVAGNTWYRRALPLLPEALGVTAAVSGGLPAVAGKPLVVKIAAGLWCAYAAGKFQKVIGQTLLGDDRTISAAELEKLDRGES
ncbi:MAG: hypothetical protein GTO22_14490 [Gemmatimonadales bacterium]|nr:hypothetical protein [Gemmatimonadales bacterium]